MSDDTPGGAVARKNQIDTEDLRDLPDGVPPTFLKDFPLSIVITDPKQDDNPIVYANSAFYERTGYTSEQVIGYNCRFLQGGHRDQAGIAALRDAIERQEEVAVDLVNYRASGTPFVNRLIITPLRDEDGETAFFMGIQTENGGSNNAAQEAVDLNNRLREVHHRVKNHLSLIISMIRMQADSQKDPRDMIKVLASRVEALSLLYEQVSDDTDAGGGDHVLLGPYISRICAALQMLSERTTIQVDVAEEPAEVTFEVASRLGLILSEVLTNALEHAFGPEQGGEIAVDLQAGLNTLTLSVTDNGRGMEDGEWPDQNSLGGRIVLSLVRGLNASLDVTNGPDSAGTRVSISIPR